MPRSIRLYQLDAFVTGDGPFTGNPAAVCPLDDWLDDALMQRIAAENNLAETAFFVGAGGRYRIRWFTPALEIDLCGHATLASAAVVFDLLEPALTRVVFDSQSGPLAVERQDGRLALDFPSRPPQACAAPEALLAGLAATPREVLAARDFFVVFDSEAEVRALRPDFTRLRTLDRLGVIATARGASADFVSRFFAPKAGVDEDPVTGSAHCSLTPFWAQRLAKKTLTARQVSPRGGALWCEDRGDRVAIAGKTALYLEGTIRV
jgi:PhzF family phenazine biosynthesis protein